MFNNGYEEQWTKLAFVLKKGLEARSRFRIVEETALSKAQNVEFPVAGGPQKRRGHTGQDVTRLVNGEATAALNVETLSFEPFQPKVLPTNWLPGYGQVSNSVTLAGTYERGGPSEYSSPCATARLGLGLVEVPATGLPAVWTGSEFVHGTGSSWDPSDTTYLPVSRLTTVAGNTHPHGQAATHPSGASITLAVGPQVQPPAGADPINTNWVLRKLTCTFRSYLGVAQPKVEILVKSEFRLLTVSDGFLLVYGAEREDDASYVVLKTTLFKADGSVLTRTIVGSNPAHTAGINFRKSRLDAVATPWGVSVVLWAEWIIGIDDFGPCLSVFKLGPKPELDEAGYVFHAGVKLTDNVAFPHAVGITHNDTFGHGVVYAYETDALVYSFKRVSDDLTNSSDWGLHGTRYAVDTSLEVNNPTVPIYPYLGGAGSTTYVNGGAVSKSDLRDAIGGAGWRCDDYGPGATSKWVTPNDFSRVAVSLRALPEVNSGEYVADVWISTIALQDGATRFGGAGTGTGVSALSPVPVTCVTSFDYNDPENTGDTRFLLGYEVGGSAICPGLVGNCLLIHHGLFGGTFVSPLGSQFGGYSPEPTYVVVDRLHRPIAKYASGTAWSGYVTRNLASGVASYGLTRITRMGGIVDVNGRTAITRDKHAAELLLVQEDYVHPLRSATLGNAVVIAGSQVWAYDGVSLGEYGFHHAPSIQAVKGAAGSGSGTAYARAILRWKDCTGQEFRSASQPTPFDAAFNVADFSVTIPLTWRSDAELVIAVTPANSPVFYEVGKIDLANRPISVTHPYVNFISAAAWGLNLNVVAEVVAGDHKRPQLPESSPGYLQPNSPPACEMVRAGQDRLWFAGGEVQPGSVTATNLYQPGYLPGWNDFHTQTVDRVAEPITDMAFLQDSAYLFKKRGVFLISSEGPDDYGQNGQWQQPRQIAQDGSPFYGTLQLTEQGIVFLGASGVKLITYGGGIQPMGSADRAFYRTGQIGKLLTPISATVYYPEKDQIRWYKQSEDAEGSAVIVESREGRFSTWTGVACTGAGYFANQRAVYVLKSNGRLWKEDADSGEIYADDGTNYTMLIRTAWISPAGLGGFGRVRRVGWWGEWLGDHQVRMRVFINEKTEHEQEYTLDWSAQTTELSSVTRWGDSFWGSGPWGGTEGNRLWRWTRRLDRQKCSTVMFELSDLGSATASFAPVSFALEVGILPNMDRVRVTDATGGAGGV